MNENTIKVIEEHLRFRNERLALREKEFGLKAKQWRTWGITLAIVALLAICGTAVCFGGWGMYSFTEKIAKSDKILETWPLTVAVIVHGVLAFAGMVVAAFTVKNIAKHNNELE